MKVDARLIVLLVVVHTIALLVHASAHVAVDVIPAGLDATFIVAVMFITPAVGAVLIARRFSYIGAWMFGGSISATLAYGFLYHFVLLTPDHVASVGFAGRGAMFLATSLLLGALEVVGVLAFLAFLKNLRSAPAASATLARDGTPGENHTKNL